jgi:hypothetical protein
MTELQAVEHEVLVLMNEDKAKALDGRIRRLANQARGQLVQVGQLLDEAKSGAIHVMLGFKSWPAYVADALGGQLELSGESRKAMVGLMAGQGMSERDIATAVSASKTTVHRDIEQLVHDGPVDPGAEVVGAEVVTDGPPENGRAAGPPEPLSEVTHRHDGKTQRRPKPKPKPKGDKPRRRPNVRKGFEHMALQVGGWADGVRDMDPAELVVDEEVQKEIDAVVAGIAAIRKFLDGVKPARKTQLLTEFRDKVAKELAPVIVDLEQLPKDPRWTKTMSRFNRRDRLNLDANITALQQLRDAMGEVYNVTPAHTVISPGTTDREQETA